ncbi:MAG TPA: beta-ketoacyl-[acyl-carrier-protein] synthase family protein [Planctomycetota bacterium]|nr:beta-ketoacyl-[acyl-carrier-protein] synthase family protein [Planctomycetota bacterium]
MRATPFQRAAVTGIGLVSGFGATTAETWTAVREGRSALDLHDLDGLRVLAAAAPVPPDDEGEPNVTLARVAAREALHDAGLAPDALASARTACTVSTSKGGMKTLFRFHREFIEGREVPGDLWGRVDPSAPGTALAGDYGITGPVINYAAACATGVHAVIAGAQLIVSGEADVVLAGAADASLVLPLVAAFDRMGVLSHRWDDPAGACRPFDRTRDGFGIGEGSAVIVMESAEHVRTRGDRVYARITGTAWGADAYDLARVKRGHSAIGMLLRQALERAGRHPREVDYLNAHGTGTVANDPMEAAGIREGLDDAADAVPVSSLKPAVGHLLGAAGGIEFALTLLAMRDGFIPPTLNLTDPDPACRLCHVTGPGLRRDVNVAVKISAGFGGHIGVVVVERGGRSA